MHCFELSSGNTLEVGRLREQEMCGNSVNISDTIITSHSSVHALCLKMSVEMPVYIFWGLRNRNPLVIVSSIFC